MADRPDKCGECKHGPRKDAAEPFSLVAWCNVIKCSVGENAPACEHGERRERGRD